MKVDMKAQVSVYEIDGEEHDTVEGEKLIVRSHWNDDDMVVLEIGGKRLTVVGADLRSAIQRCSR